MNFGPKPAKKLFVSVRILTPRPSPDQGLCFWTILGDAVGLGLCPHSPSPTASPNICYSPSPRVPGKCLVHLDNDYISRTWRNTT